MPITILPHGTPAYFLAEYTPTDSRALDREFEGGFRGTGETRRQGPHHVSGVAVFQALSTMRNRRGMLRSYVAIWEDRGHWEAKLRQRDHHR